MNYPNNPYLNSIYNPTMNPNMYQSKANVQDIIFVQGIEGAKAYQIEPGRKAVLFDSENDGRLYIKICDDAGMSKLRFFTYKEVENPSSAPNLSEYVRKDELEQMLNNMLGGSTDESTVSRTRSNENTNTTKH